MGTVASGRPVRRVLPLSERKTVLNITKKEKNAEAAKIFVKNKSIHKLGRKEEKFVVVLLSHFKLQKISYSAW